MGMVAVSSCTNRVALATSGNLLRAEHVTGLGAAVRSSVSDFLPTDIHGRGILNTLIGVCLCRSDHFLIVAGFVSHRSVKKITIARHFFIDDVFHVTVVFERIQELIRYAGRQ